LTGCVFSSHNGNTSRSFRIHELVFMCLHAHHVLSQCRSADQLFPALCTSNSHCTFHCQFFAGIMQRVTCILFMCSCKTYLSTNVAWTLSTHRLFFFGPHCSALVFCRFLWDKCLLHTPSLTSCGLIFHSKIIGNRGDILTTLVNISVKRFWILRVEALPIVNKNNSDTCIGDGIKFLMRPQLQY
jgi:hypothetical protein